MNINIGSVIRSLRGEKNISQEILAEKMGVSIQAVSKWECGASYPDIALLPDLAEYFNVTVDYLLCGKNFGNRNHTYNLPDDDALRIVQFKGNRIIKIDEYNPEVRIMLKINEDDYSESNKRPIRVEVWGSADIKGNISGGISAGDSVNCGNVNGGIDAGDGVNCGNVSGGINAGDSVNCGNVSGGIDAGDTVNCGNVSGGISAGDYIKCNDIINGDIIRCDGDVYCRDIKGNVNCKGNIIYKA